MELKDIKSVYFVGIGGIGMSAIARYFLHIGVQVGGYDRTPSALTKKLEEEGAQIHYEDNLSLVPPAFLSPETTLVVFTPAIPSSHSELAYFKSHGFTVEKRAPVAQCALCGGHTRQDHHQQHGRAHPAPEPCGL